MRPTICSVAPTSWTAWEALTTGFIANNYNGLVDVCAPALLHAPQALCPPPCGDAWQLPAKSPRSVSPGVSTLPKRPLARLWSVPMAAPTAIPSPTPTQPPPLPPSAAQPFHWVSPALLRGQRPHLEELPTLRGMGVKTIINLEDSITWALWPWDPSPSVEQLKTAAAALDMQVLFFPMSCVLPLDRAQVDEILAVIADPARQPVMVHCWKGLERTNFIVAMYRVFQQGWSPQRAYAEMLQTGFRRPLVVVMWRQFFEFCHDVKHAAQDAAHAAGDAARAVGDAARAAGNAPAAA